MSGQSFWEESTINQSGARSMLNPQFELFIAGSWVDIYHRAVAHQPSAVSDVQRRVQAWADAKPGSTAAQERNDVLSYMGGIDPKAAAAFRKSIFEDRGCIKFE